MEENIFQRQFLKLFRREIVTRRFKRLHRRKQKRRQVRDIGVDKKGVPTPPLGWRHLKLEKRLL